MIPNSDSEDEKPNHKKLLRKESSDTFELIEIIAQEHTPITHISTSTDNIILNHPPRPPTILTH